METSWIRPRNCKVSKTNYVISTVSAPRTHCGNVFWTWCIISGHFHHQRGTFQTTGSTTAACEVMCSIVTSHTDGTKYKSLYKMKLGVSIFFFIMSSLQGFVILQPSYKRFACSASLLIVKFERDNVRAINPRNVLCFIDLCHVCFFCGERGQTFGNNVIDERILRCLKI